MFFYCNFFSVLLNVKNQIVNFEFIENSCVFEHDYNFMFTIWLNSLPTMEFEF